MAISTIKRLKFDGVAGPRQRRRLQVGAVGRQSWIAGLVCAGLMAVLSENAIELLNPDWFAYKTLFESEGGWLAEQGRDPLFLLLMQLAVQSLGIGGYDDFRNLLGVFFTVATLLLAAGFVLPFTNGKPALVALILAVVVFSASRFTIQIREGIAMVFVLLALRQIWDRPMLRTRPALATALMLAATLVHGGIALLLVTLIAAVGLGSTLGQSGDRCRKLRYLTPWVIVAALLGTVFVLNSGLTAGLVGTLDDGRESFDRSSSLKYLYWGLTSLGLVCVAHAASRCIYQPTMSPVLRAFMGLMTYVILPAVLAAALLQLALGSSGVLIAATTRLVQMTSNLVILILAARRQMTWQTGLTAFFFIADQVRVSIDSISGQLLLLDS
jgi:hypothetical protein